MTEETNNFNDNSIDSISNKSQLYEESINNNNITIYKDIYKNFYGESSNKISSSNNDSFIKKDSNSSKQITFCKNCNTSYEIDYKILVFLSMECDCCKIDGCTLKEILENYIIKNENQIEKSCICSIHNEEYIKYCEDCKKNLCKKCLEELKQENNKNLKKHETHTKLDLKDINIKESKKIKNLIKKIKKEIPEECDDFIKFLDMIENVIIKNKDYLCYNVFKSLNNSYNFLSIFYKNNFYNKCIFQKDSLKEKAKIMRKITTIEELEKYKSEPIYSIKIINQKFKDISNFERLKLENLEILELIGNGIEDISPLNNFKFKNLKILDLEDNNLNDECLNVIKNFESSNLKFLNLFNNKIESIKIFDIIIKNFPNLKTFFIGQNKFTFKENDLNEKYKLSSKLEELGITRFDSFDIVINFFSILKLEELKILYLSRNKICKLEFLEKIKFKKLEEIWLSFNDLTNLEQIGVLLLHCKDTLKIINLKGNKISNIDKKVLEIIKSFKCLEKINLENNLINSIDECILNNLKNKKGKKLIIEF